ncbi:MAG: TetR/AcrR family transcriptional regulator [Desulfobacterales bacterium]|nr:TetR/AcrR family transcriptional regulator [Desulfobacterales bacterium]
MNRRARTPKAKQEKKEQILAAAKALFFEKGFYGTRIEMIAKKAGVSTGTVYLYYKNKIEVYKALQDEGVGILSEMISQVISWPGMSALAKLSEVARTYYRFHNEYREYFDIMAILCVTPKDLKESESEISKIIDGKTFSLLKMVEGVLQEGIEKSEFISLDTWKATNVFWGMLDGLILLAERRNIENVIGVDLEELFKQALEMSFYGILKQN